MWGQNNKIPTLSDWAEALEPSSNKYVWNVDELDKFKSAAVGDKFVSNKFVMYGATWRLNCYPNGQKEDGRGYISVFLRCCNFGRFSTEYEVQYTVNIRELNESQTCTHNYSRSQSRGWTNFCSNQTLSTLDTLTIECTIHQKGPLDSPLFVYRQKLAQLPILQMKLRAAESRLEDAADYIVNPVEPPSMILDHDINEQKANGNAQSGTSHVDTDLYNKHIAIISAWDRETFALKAFQSMGTEEMNVENDDDDEKVEIPSDHLMDKYLESRTIVKKQLNRISRVTNEEHLLELVNHQKSLSV